MTDAPAKFFLVLKTVTAQSANGDSYTHQPGSVLSDWEVNEYIREQINDGSAHYRAHFEPLTDEEAKHHRVKATATAAKRFGRDGQQLQAPWDDYVGLHPEEILARLRKSSSLDEVAHVKNYERAGFNRSVITGFTAPVEREPFTDYANLGVREVLTKMAILSDADVRDVVNYELAHRRRPAIIQWERESYEGSSASESETELATA